jgi:hypothetical protein
MILTVRDDYNKFEGTDLPMFSRSGRFTSNQYLCFNQKGKGQKEEVLEEKVEDDDEDAGQADIGMMMGEKPRDIAQEM